MDIVLHPDEPPLQEEVVTTLTYLPAYILIKLTRTRATMLEGLEHAVIPVEPMSVKSQIKVCSCDNKILTHTVTRTQFPITAAYAFTDYHVQG